MIVILVQTVFQGSNDKLGLCLSRQGSQDTQPLGNELGNAARVPVWRLVWRLSRVLARVHAKNGPSRIDSKALLASCPCDLSSFACKRLYGAIRAVLASIMGFRLFGPSSRHLYLSDCHIVFPICLENRPQYPQKSTLRLPDIFTGSAAWTVAWLHTPRLATAMKPGPSCRPGHMF